jgi:hypothetical protein
MSVTFTVTAYVPAAEGVPLMTPVLALIERPVGEPLADHVNGVVPSALVIVWLG